MGLQGVVATLPLLQRQGGSCLSRSRPKPRPAPSSEPRLHLIRPPADARPQSEPDPDPAPPSPLCHFGCLWFQPPPPEPAGGSGGARRGGCEGAEPLPGPAGWWAARPAHPPRTTFLPHTGFFLTPAPACQVGELPAPPRSLQQPRAAGFGTSRLRCRCQKEPREGPGHLRGPKRRLPGESAGWEKRGATAGARGWGSGEDPAAIQAPAAPPPNTPATDTPGARVGIASPPVAHLRRKRNPRS